MPSALHRPAILEEPTIHRATAFETSLGWMVLKHDGKRLQQVAFGYPTFANLLSSDSATDCELEDCASGWVKQLSESLLRFADGDPQEFSDVPIDLSHLTPFAKQVVTQCRKLTWGSVLTYAQLAKQSGRPGAARAVGNVMATNRFPLVVPCHRVVGSNGGLGGYSAPGGLVTKQRLLEVEGAF